MQKNNAFNIFYFCPNFFSYRFIPNFKKWCDSSKSQVIFSEKRFFTTLPFPIFGIKFVNRESVDICLSNMSSRLENCSFEINAFKVLNSRKS